MIWIPLRPFDPRRGGLLRTWVGYLAWRSQKDLGRSAEILHRPRRDAFPQYPLWSLASINSESPSGGHTKVGQIQQETNYLLTDIDALCKIARAEPVQNKTSVTIRDAMQLILKRASSRRPLCLQRDHRKTFNNRTFQAWLKQVGIGDFSTYVDSKASVSIALSRNVCTVTLRLETRWSTWMLTWTSIFFHFNLSIFFSFETLSVPIPWPPSMKIYKPQVHTSSSRVTYQ